MADKRGNNWHLPCVCFLFFCFFLPLFCTLVSHYRLFQSSFVLPSSLVLSVLPIYPLFVTTCFCHPPPSATICLCHHSSLPPSSRNHLPSPLPSVTCTWFNTIPLFFGGTKRMSSFHSSFYFPPCYLFCPWTFFSFSRMSCIVTLGFQKLLFSIFFFIRLLISSRAWVFVAVY